MAMKFCASLHKTPVVPHVTVRNLIHWADAVTKDFNKVLLRTVGTDVVVLAVAAAARINVQELWVAFGTAKSFWHIPEYEIARSLGPIKSLLDQHI